MLLVIPLGKLQRVVEADHIKGIGDSLFVVAIHRG